MNGLSGTYAINGTTLLLSPSNAGWGNKDIIGVDGAGHSLYPAVNEYIMEWGLMSPTELKQLQDAFISTQTTGTAVVDLPKWGDADYTFYSYSGTIISRPQVNKYFAEYVRDVTLTITNIRVS
jgi:hypothetical protein